MTEKQLIKMYKRDMEIIEEKYGRNQENVKFDKLTIEFLEEHMRYRAIGTVDECRDAMERQKWKKVVCRSFFTDGTRFPNCPICFSRIDRGTFYCSNCGQKLDWG